MSKTGTTPTTLPIINGFQLLKKLGQGGMGAVFMARQLSMDRIVAVKVLPSQFARDKAFVERFMREARLAGKLNHENVVNAIDAGCENGTYYLVMEYVEGSTVRDLIQKRGVLAEAEALKILRQAAAGLKCAHENGLIHRDVKPDNLLLDKEGTVKLADLGLARSSKDDSSLTQTGTALGTPSYIAPEQARGDRDIDHRADLYALGAMLYHMLTGQTPFKGETAAVIMAKHLTEEPVHPRERNPNAKISDGACQLVSWMMRKDAGERPASAQDVIEAIDRVEAGQPALLGMVSRGGSRGRRTGQHAPVSSSSSQRRGTEGPLKVIGPRIRDEGGYATRVGVAPAKQNSTALIAVGAAAALIVLGLILSMGSGGSSVERRSAQASRSADKQDRAPDRSSAEPDKAPEAPAPKAAPRPAPPPPRESRDPREGRPEPRPEPARAQPSSQPQGQPELTQAQRELNEITSYAQDHPDDVKGIIARLAPYAERYNGTHEGTLAAMGLAAMRIKLSQMEETAKRNPQPQHTAERDPAASPAAESAPKGAESGDLIAARKAYGESYDEIAKALKARDIAAAQKLLRQAAGKKELKPLRSAIAEDEADVGRIDKLIKQAEKNVDLRKGEEIVINGGMRGTVVGTENGRVNLSLGKNQGSTSVVFRDRFSSEEIVATFDKNPGMTPPEAARARAAFWIGMQEIPLAEASLKDVAEAQRPRYQEAIDVLKKGRAEVLKQKTEAEADASAKQILDLDKQGKSKEAWAQYEAGLKLYKDTQAYASKSAEFEQLKDRVLGRSGVEMVKIAGGVARMGEEQQNVAPFQMDKDRVTNKEYRKFVRWLLNEKNAEESGKLLGGIAERYSTTRELWEYIPRYMPEFREYMTAKAKEWGQEASDRWSRKMQDMKDVNERVGGDDQPAVDVTWYGALAYAQWVGKRLPTAAEWQMASANEGCLNMLQQNWFEWCDQPGQCRGSQPGREGPNLEMAEIRPGPRSHNVTWGFRCARDLK